MPGQWPASDEWPSLFASVVVIVLEHLKSKQIKLRDERRRKRRNNNLEESSFDLRNNVVA